MKMKKLRYLKTLILKIHLRNDKQPIKRLKVCIS